MKRREFYRVYYARTNRNFSDKIIWKRGEKGDAWRKGQDLSFTSKIGRICYIFLQYFMLLLGGGLICYGIWSWSVAPILLIMFACFVFITDFSIIKIELLYFIFSRKNAYSELLYEVFLNTSPTFCNELEALTKKRVTGYYLNRGGTFGGTFLGICRKKNEQISVILQNKRVVVKINRKKTMIQNKALTREQLLAEIAAVINDSN